MHKGSDCNNCIKLVVCKLIEDYNNQCSSSEDINNDNYVSCLHCKHYEERIKYGNK